MNKREYKTAEEVKKRAEEAIGIPFSEVRKLAEKFQTRYGLKAHTGKGDIGQTYEEGWFNYMCNNESKPDFEEADIELKVSPYLKNSRGYRVKERLVLGMIGYDTENFTDFYKSHFWIKNHTLLIMYYFYSKTLSKKDYTVKKVDLLELDKLPRRDFKIIKHDWEKIAKAVTSGKAHELTERDFVYLSPCTKGCGKQKPIKYNEFFPKAKKRAYSFKSSYMTELFNRRMLSEDEKSSVFNTTNALRGTTFDEKILGIIQPYLGRTQNSLIEEFGLESYRGYNVKNLILSKIFKIECELDETDEFRKANYRFRTITVNKKNMPEEDMSFGNFYFKDILKEKNWSESQVFEEMVAPKFLLAVFSYNVDGDTILNNCMFWYLPDKDIKKLKSVWQETKKVLMNGVVLEQSVTRNKKGKLIYTYLNNFPKTQKDGVAHVRNKARLCEYFVKNAYSDELPKKAAIKLIGKVPEELKDTPVPDGGVMTKQCFWFDKKYIKKQIEPHILKYQK